MKTQVIKSLKISAENAIESKKFSVFFQNFNEFPTIFFKFSPTFSAHLPMHADLPARAARARAHRGGQRLGQWQDFRTTWRQQARVSGTVRLCVHGEWAHRVPGHRTVTHGGEF